MPDWIEAERQSFSVVRRAVEKTRLMIEGGGVVSTADVLSKLNAAWTEYCKAELVVAVSLVQAGAQLYQDKLNRWETLVRQREEAVKQRSIQKFRQIQGVHNPIRTNTRQIPAAFQHLIAALEDRIKKESRAGEPEPLTDAGPEEESIDGVAEEESAQRDRPGFRAFTDLLGSGLQLQFAEATLEPPFTNPAIREQVWQNRAVVFVVSWSNGNQLVNASAAPLSLHFWLIPKTPAAQADLKPLANTALTIENQRRGTAETLVLTPAAENLSPATPYNTRIKDYIARKSEEFLQSSPDTPLTLFCDALFTTIPFREGCRDTFLLRLE